MNLLQLSLYQVNPNILIYNASDSSGVFVFVPITGNSLRLSGQFQAFFTQYHFGVPFNEEQMFALFPDSSLIDIQQSIRHLESQCVIQKVESVET
ncbi:hypothetical protein Patl_1210 [Paraglaciecola sp. T6c]|nr:hypothetical protein Patl_1210 [Paraglaciecola sp. T6c]